MALLFLKSRRICRRKGASVVPAAAYRSGERIRDERTRKLYDFSARKDIPYKEVLLPDELAGRPDMRWAYSRDSLWNAVERGAQRKNAALAREWLIVPPEELNQAQRIALVRDFGRYLANQYRTPVDVCLHLPRAEGHQSNHHAHLLMATREVGPEGFGERTILELSGPARRRRGLQNSWEDEAMSVRERCAHFINEALREAGFDVRVDYRSLAAQGIDREPGPSLPPAVAYMERRNGPTAAGNAIRRQHAERVEARQKGPEELARVLERQKQETAEYFKAKAARPPEQRRRKMTEEERKARKREAERTRRQIENQDPELAARRREQERLRYEERKRDPEQWRRAYAKNKDRVLARMHAHYQENKEAICAKARARRAANPEEVRRKDREYHARRRAALRKEKFAALEAERVHALLLLEQQKQQGAAATPGAGDSGLERVSTLVELPGQHTRTTDDEERERIYDTGLEI